MMALKDWKKDKIWETDLRDIHLSRINHKLNLWLVVLDEYSGDFETTLRKTGRIQVDVRPLSALKNLTPKTKLIIRKNFKTKAQALKFAKDYMKKH